MKIFVTGQCTLHWGRLENGNIGNYYITETTFRELHRVFPEAEIVTTFQMTEAFQERESVKVVPMSLFYSWSDTDLAIALEEYAIAELYAKTGKIVKYTPYIDEILTSDLVIDFSGEMWGYHADLVGKDRFLVGLLKDRVAQLLGKPTVMLAGSQGSFPDPQIKIFAKEVFEHFNLVANREAETGKLLVEEGFDVSNLKNYACPAFLFEPLSDAEIAPVLKKEQISKEKSNKVGFVLCGFNMLTAPYDKWPREDAEYDNFVELVEYIVNELKCEVYFMSHSNGFELPPAFKLINGRDFPIVKQLKEIVEKRGNVDPSLLHLIDGPYTPKETKAIIRQFDMFVTGRLHASVAAVSQSVPTVVMMHGHKMKSHKTIGFFDIVGLPECVAYPSDVEDMKRKVHDCWINRAQIRAHLEKRIPEVQKLAHSAFDDLKNVVYEHK